MTKENVKRIKERITNLIDNVDNTEDYKLWNKGYNTASKQILQMILEIETDELKSRT